MSHDGRILSLVRDAIAAEKAENEAELARREGEAFSRCPELKAIDTRIARLMTSTITGALRTGSDAGRAVASARTEVEALRGERVRLLASLNLPENYLEPIYTCEKCRDSGYVLGKPCTCLDARCRAESAKALSSMLDTRGQCFESFDLEKYDDAPLPEQNTTCREAMREVFGLCRDYADGFGADSPSLLFRGGTGLGKTFLSASIAKVVSEAGFSVVYDSAVAVFDAFETQKFDRGGELSEAVNTRVRRYLDCELLILDDLGTEMTTAFTNSALYTIINSRLLSGGKTIISTNLSSDELCRRYTPQIVSRLEGCYMRLNFFGADIRQKK